MTIWQGIVGDPGERGTPGEKGRPVCMTNQLQRHENNKSLLWYKYIRNIFFVILWKLGDPRTWWQSWHHWAKGDSQLIHWAPLHLTYTPPILYWWCVFPGHHWRSRLTRERRRSRNRGIIICWQWYLSDEFWKPSASTNMCYLFLTGLSRTTRSRGKTWTKWSKGNSVMLFGYVNKC